jgi:hypothetical protein
MKGQFPISVDLDSKANLKLDTSLLSEVIVGTKPVRGHFWFPLSFEEQTLQQQGLATLVYLLRLGRNSPDECTAMRPQNRKPEL